MRTKLMLAALAAVATLAVLPRAQAQMATVKGRCTDEQRQPIVNAIVEYASLDTGRKYNIKTNKSGDYYSIGLQSGKYKVTLYRNEEDQKAGRSLYFFNNVTVTLSGVEGVNTLDFDLAKERATAAPQMTEEQRKQIEEAQKENVKIKNLNDMLAQARAALSSNPPNADQAVALMQQAVAVDPSKDLLWYTLGDSYLAGKHYPEAAEAYQKAIAIKPNGAYYNNLGQALAGSRKVDEAVAAYEAAAAADPAGAGQYYFNMGAVLTNAGRLDAALAAFDKCIAADPGNASAYFQKGSILMGKGTMDKNNKFVAPPGTAEAFNKYLELAPEGPYAENAKQLLQYIGSEIESTYKRSKTTKKN
ncbi:MAG TPA: tetratricopeptide repeat protein [Terriglobales bacterium]|nr:tetratricopeptide repeat protein [Terriglobales bacterium]